MRLNRLRLYIVIAFALIMADISIWFVVIPFDRDLGYGLFTNIIVTIATIILLMYLIESRDDSEWKPVKQKVYDRIGIELDAILSLSFDLYEITWTATTPPNITIGLRDLVMLWSDETSDARFAECLRRRAREELREGKYLSFFEARRRILSEIEAKYSRFLRPDLVGSLMEIQNNLLSITIYHSLLDPTDEDDQEQTFNEISERIHNIIKEVQKISMMGIEIIKYPTFYESRLMHQ